jgi:hypothetical protein
LDYWPGPTSFRAGIDPKATFLRPGALTLGEAGGGPDYETGQRQTGSPNSKSASYRPSAHRAYDALATNDAHGVKQALPRQARG